MSLELGVRKSQNPRPHEARAGHPNHPRICGAVQSSAGRKDHRQLTAFSLCLWLIECKLGKGTKMQKVIIKDANILGGEPVFRGTRVPFKALTDYLEGGESLEQFLEQYPSVSRELAIAAIEEARCSLVSQLR